MQGILGFSDRLDGVRVHVEEVWEGYQKDVAISKGLTALEGPLFRDGAYGKVALKSPSFRGFFFFFSDGDAEAVKAYLESTKSLTFAFSVAFHDAGSAKHASRTTVQWGAEVVQDASAPYIWACTTSTTKLS